MTSSLKLALPLVRSNRLLANSVARLSRSSVVLSDIQITDKMKEPKQIQVDFDTIHTKTQ